MNGRRSPRGLAKGSAFQPSRAVVSEFARLRAFHATEPPRAQSAPREGGEAQFTSKPSPGPSTASNTMVCQLIENHFMKVS